MNNFALVDLGIDIFHGDVWIVWCPSENLEAAKQLYPEADGYRFGDRRREPRITTTEESKKWV